MSHIYNTRGLNTFRKARQEKKEFAIKNNIREQLLLENPQLRMNQVLLNNLMKYRLKEVK